MASFNRVKANTFTPRPSVWYQVYRSVVEAKYNDIAADMCTSGLVPFEKVLDTLQATRSHFVGASVLLSRTQIAFKLGISKQTVYRLFRLDIAPEGVPSHLNNETKFYSDDVFHFIRKVYPRHTPICKAVLLLQIEAALDTDGVSNMQALSDWILLGKPCNILVQGGRHV